MNLAGGPGTTVRLAVPLLPSDVAVIVTVPSFFELATPAASIETIVGSELLHVTGRVRVVPSMSLIVVVNCRVLTTGKGVRSPPMATVSTLGCIITAYTAKRLTFPVTVFAVRFTVLPGTTRHDDPTSSYS